MALHGITALVTLKTGTKTLKGTPSILLLHLKNSFFIKNRLFSQNLYPSKISDIMLDFILIYPNLYILSLFPRFYSESNFHHFLELI